MLNRAFHWLIAIALVTQSLSLTSVMTSAHANSQAAGLWTISCTGNPMLLPVSGTTDDNSPMGQCLYCGGDSPDNTTANGTSVLLYHSVATEHSAAIPPESTGSQIDACHPARAPPRIP